MIAKMRFVKLTGPADKFDLAVEQYVSKYEIQLENAVAELKDITGVRSSNENNPYREVLQRARQYAEEYAGSVTSVTSVACDDITPDEAGQAAALFMDEISELERKKKGLLDRIEIKSAMLKDIGPYSMIHSDIQKLRNMKYIKYRFGRIASEYYRKLQDYLEDDMCSVFCECANDGKCIWGIYFVPASQSHKIDSIYSSMHFERIQLSDEYSGSLVDAKKNIESDIEELRCEVKSVDDSIEAYKSEHAEAFMKAYERLNSTSSNYEVRRLAAFTSIDDYESFVLCGWMTVKNAEILEQKLKADKCSDIYIMSEDEHEGPLGGAPVKLENPKILKPFEMLIRMYGLPDYHEMDPTWFVALTYTILFGFMFGDVGQGFVLAVGGFILYKVKKMDLAAVISVAGIFSMIFGFMFGSIFGYEEAIMPLWIRPTGDMSDIPFVGKLNMVFISAILIGMVLIMVVMVFNIINGIKMGCVHEVLFDHNGVCGLVFYASVCATIVAFMTGHTLPGTIILAVMFGVPLLLIILKEPLVAIITKKTDELPKEKGVMVVQMFFEIFEVLLSYFSNTLSFVRLGGFAVSHASMMAVVIMLAGAEHGGTGNILVIILGNLLVCLLEGLIVGIQAMRLEYYEMFSRFYKGGGREFTPYK